PQQRAYGIGEILAPLGQAVGPALLAHGGFVFAAAIGARGFEVAELPGCLLSGGTLAQPPSAQLGDAHVEMKRELSVDVACDHGARAPWELERAIVGRHGLTRSGGTQHFVHGSSVRLPHRGFSAEPRAPGGHERVVLGLPVVFRDAPLRGDQLLTLEPMKALVERRPLHRENAIAPRVEPARDGITVHGVRGDGAKDEDVDRTLQHLGWRALHYAPVTR